VWLYRLHKEDDRIRALALTEEVGQGEGDIRAGFHCFALKRGRCSIVFLAIAIALAICTFVDDCFYTPPDTHSVTPHLRFYDSLLHLPCVTELVGFLSCFRFGQAFTCTRYTRFVGLLWKMWRRPLHLWGIEIGYVGNQSYQSHYTLESIIVCLECDCWCSTIRSMTCETAKQCP
jgi:hypothetical protein